MAALPILSNWAMMAPQMTIRLGSFLLQQPIGRGGMSEVWLAKHAILGLPVAVKVLTTRSDMLRLAFSGEVRAMARIDHPGVVAVFDHGLVDAAAQEDSQGALIAGTPWMAMEYCSGGTLEGFTPANWNGLRRVLYDLMGALAVAHARNVLHLDLKPENVLVSTSQDLRPGRKLTDFGLSFAEQEEDDICVLGTPAYMAPEQFQRQWRDYGPWTDLYALGCVGWALVTGQPPFGADRPPEVLMMAHEELPPPRLRPRLAVPEGLEAWLRRLLEKSPDRRFASAMDALLSLQAVDGDPPPPHRVPRLWQGETRPDKKVIGMSMFGLRSLPIVGRTAERDAMWGKLWAVGAQRRPAVMVLHGPSGVGKNRLVSWICERSGELGAATCLRVRLEGGIAAMLRQWFRSDGLRREEILHRLERRLPDMDAYAREVLAGIMLGDDLGAAERYATLKLLISALSRSAPLLLCLEDAWVLSEGLDLMERVLSADDPVLIMVTTSPEALKEHPVMAMRLQSVASGPQAHWLEIPPLTDAEMDSLLREHLRLGPDLTSLVTQRAAGNPAFAVQVVSDWVHRGILASEAGGLALRSGAVPSLPEDMEAVWAARLDRVLEGKVDVYMARRCLEVAALFQEEIDMADWLGACAQSGLDVPPDLVTLLMDAHLLRWGQNASRKEWCFAHTILRESLVNEVEVAGRARVIHLAIARVLQRRISEPGVCERIAGHLVALGAEGEAQRALQRAAEQAQQQGERSHALRLLERSIQLLTKVPATERRHAEVGLLKTRWLHDEGDYEGARVAAEGTVGVARAQNWPDLLALALVELADTTRIRGWPTQAMESYQEARQLFSAKGDKLGTAGCLVGLGALAGQLGELGQGIRLLQQAQEIFTEAGQRRRRADSLRELADMGRKAGRLEEADLWATEALALYRSPSVPAGLAAVTNIQGAIARQGGRLYAGESLALRALRMFEALDSRQVVHPLCNLSLCYAMSDRFTESRAAIERALPLLSQAGRRVLEGLAHSLILPSLAAQDDRVGWDRHFALTLQRIEQQDIVDPDIAEALVLAARRHKDPRQALMALELARSQWVSLGFQARVAEVNAAILRLG